MISELELNQKINYIHFNPVKSKYCTEMIDWKYSSAEFYETGKEGVIKLKSS